MLDSIYHYLHAFLKKRRGYCNPLCPSVCLLCYLLLNRWTNFNQICTLTYFCSHKGGVQRQFFCPAPWGPGEGSKGQISFIFKYKVNFKDFDTKLCVFFHKLKIQNISDRIGLSGGWACRGRQFFFKHGHVAYQINEDDKQNRTHVIFFIIGSNW